MEQTPVVACSDCSQTAFDVLKPEDWLYEITKGQSALELVLWSPCSYRLAIAQSKSLTLRFDSI